MLGAVDQTYLHSILRNLAAGNGAALIADADRMSERSLSFEMALQDLGALLHRLALLQLVPQAIADDDPDAETLRELAALFNAEDLQLYYQIAVQARGEIGLAPDEYAGFTMALLRMLAFAPASEEPSPRATPAPVAKPAFSGTAPSGPSDASERREVSAAQAANGDGSLPWPDIVEQLGITGMARMLAQHCELMRRDANRIELTLPKAHERLLEKAYQERLKAALQKRFGETVHVSISVGEGSGNSPVAIAQRERDRQQARAIADIEQDPFVRELVENFDARVNESSIKPLQ
jgi:DNA polymerase-3 subunit gamma/tau